jgi:hypothetical protein
MRRTKGNRTLGAYKPLVDEVRWLERMKGKGWTTNGSPLTQATGRETRRRTICRKPTAHNEESRQGHRQTRTDVGLTGKGAEQGMGGVAERRCRMVPVLGRLHRPGTGQGRLADENVQNKYAVDEQPSG